MPRAKSFGTAFVDGYHVAIETPQPEGLAARLAAIDNELRGFAYEGAGMGLALLDMVLPWSRRRMFFIGATLTLSLPIAC